MINGILLGLLDSEDKHTKIHRNFGNYLIIHTAQQSKSIES